MPYVEVNKTLKKLTVDKNIRQVDLAEKLGISMTEMSFWCNGYKPVPVEYLGKLARALDMRKDELLEVLDVAG